MKLKRPDLVVGHMQQSKRDKARPYILAAVIVSIIILKSVVEVYAKQ